MEEVLHCKNHPDRETLLRCNKCGEPICLDCAVLTDVGYRCKQCIRAVQDIYYNAKPRDNWIALVVSLSSFAFTLSGLVRVLPYTYCWNTWFLRRVIA